MSAEQKFIKHAERARRGETVVVRVTSKKFASSGFVEGLEKLGAGERLLNSAKGNRKA